jgi:hypothetical protein
MSPDAIGIDGDSSEAQKPAETPYWRAAAAVTVGVAIALVVWGIKEHWDADKCLAVSALYVSVWGFVIAISEIRRAASVSQATKEAIARTLRGVRAGRLGITITQLRHSVAELEEATIDKDPLGARRALND